METDKVISEEHKNISKWFKTNNFTTNLLHVIFFTRKSSNFMK